jgi:hypothetical protein
VQAVDAAIEDAADRLGIPRLEFEERVVPAFGLDRNGRRNVPIGDHTAELALGTDGGCALRFRTPAGRAVKSVPAAVKRDHPRELAELKQAVKDIKAMAAAQRIRLERLLLDDRSWPDATWRERYVEHGLVGPLARNLIWVADGRAAIQVGGQLVAHDGSAIPAPAEVRLWHPVDADPDDVKAWRRFLEEREITQPFKQAHREIYLLSAAERETRTYSNRFASHILRQHQLAALAQGRGWRYALQGEWDPGDDSAVLDLPRHELRVALRVERPPYREDLGQTGVYPYVVSGQVRFGTLDGGPAPLEDIPARVLSETMRDVDLFVGVTSIGNDPEYWHEYASGELTEHSRVRGDLLERLLPRLAIAGVARVDGRYLRVQGRLRAYRIHLGSSNILMEPNDEYLCIVPGHGHRAGGKVFLPFEGDAVLTMILSKAFLLAKDDEITDETIVAQIRR